ncbi:hypothetical protein [Aeoliella sp. SH292]|uniref:hypothetical protein n=1 Tax=Aeoliella sp. SH292 TaxID=3454464 RepID=UPI003F975E40
MESTDLYEPPLVYSSFFGEASLFTSAFNFVEELIEYACDRVFAISIPNFEAKETLSSIPEDEWTEANEIEMQRYICDLAAFLARLGQLPTVSDGELVLDELVREAKAVADFRKTGRSWAGDRHRANSAANRGCDAAKLAKALQYVKAYGPVEKQLLIAKHIDVSLATFRSNFVPVLKSQGMYHSKEGWKVTEKWSNEHI